MIRSEPKGAEVFLNGKPSGKTPSNIRFLPPGVYDVKLQKNGYATWEKQLSVIARQVTLAHPENERIPLFLAEPPEKNLTDDALGFWYGNQKIWSWNATSTIKVTNLGTGQTANTAIPYRSGAEIEISPEGKWIFARSDDDIAYAYNLDSRKKIAMPSKLGNIVKIEALDDKFFILTKQRDFFEFDAQTASLSARKTGISAFSLDSDYIYYYENSIVYRAKTSSSTPELISASLPKSGDVRIIPAGARGIFVLSERKLYQANGAPKLLSANATDARWYEEGKILIFSESNSIWSYSPENDQTPRLITRSGTQLKYPQLSWNIRQIFYQEDGKIKTVELSGQVNRAIQTIFDRDGEKSSRFFVNPAGDTIYARTENGLILELKIR